MRLDRAVLVDLSLTLGPGPSEVLPVEIDHVSHLQGGEHLASLLQIPVEALPDGEGWASERVSAYTHVGTHMDAPFHCGPGTADEPNRTIDQVPLDWCWGRAVCLRVAECDDERPVGLAEMLELEAEIGGIRPATIVLFRTGAERWHGSSRYATAGRPLAPEAVEALIERGVRVIGTDSWSIDPSIAGIREAVRRGGPGAAWAAHRVGRRHEFCIIERLDNLGRLPSRDFWLSCFPIKVRGGSAGWVRAVALVPGGDRDDD